MSAENETGPLGATSEPGQGTKANESHPQFSTPFAQNQEAIIPSVLTSVTTLAPTGRQLAALARLASRRPRKLAKIRHRLGLGDIPLMALPQGEFGRLIRLTRGRR